MLNARDRQDRQELITGWAEFLDQYDWEGFWTLTFQKNYGIWAAQRAFRKWVSRFTRAEPLQPTFFGFIEWGHRYPVVPHIHAVSRAERVSRKEMWGDWFKRYGRARSEAYNPSLGGNYYLSKYLTKENVDVIIDEREVQQWEQEVVIRSI